MLQIHQTLVIQEGDILFFDFHPVFEGWEADLGRTYVLGNDPLKLKDKKRYRSRLARRECLVF